MNATPDHIPGENADRDPIHLQSLTQALIRLVDQSVWANRQWTEFVYTQPDKEVRPRELLGHIMVGERVWFERIDGQQRTTAMLPLLSKEELLQGFTENAEIYRHLIRTCLDDDIQFRRGTGVEYHARVEDIIHHLLTHGYHHRGQLAAHYARSGVKYPDTDHINYLIENML